MENYRAKVKKRLSAAAVYNMLLLVIFVLNLLLGREMQIPDFTKGFTGGFCIGIQLVILYFIVKYMRALKDEKKLKAMCIEENDERICFIGRKVCQTGFIVVMGAVSLGMVVSIFINQIVFFTLLATALFIAFLSVGLRIYYEKKI